MHRLVRNIRIISVLTRWVACPKDRPSLRSVDDIKLLLYEPDRRALVVADVLALGESSARICSK